MSYRIRRTEAPPDALRRIASGQLDCALSKVEHARDVGVRRRCEKIRGLLRLARASLGSQYPAANAAVRDASRRLSGVRDVRAHLEVLRSLRGRTSRLGWDRVHAVSPRMLTGRLSGYWGAWRSSNELCLMA